MNRLAMLFALLLLVVAMPAQASKGRESCLVTTECILNNDEHGDHLSAPAAL